MYKEVVKGINTKTSVRGSRVKYLHMPKPLVQMFDLENP